MLSNVGNQIFRAATPGKASRAIKRLLMALDSLSDSAGGSTYRTSFMSALRAKYGDGGLGLSQFGTAQGGVTFFYGGGFGNAFTSLVWSDAGRLANSFFGAGMYSYNISTGSYAVLYASTDDNEIIAVSVLVRFTAAGQSFKIKQYDAGATQITISSDVYGFSEPVWITVPMQVAFDGSTVRAGIAINDVNTNGANYVYWLAHQFHYADTRAGVDFANLGIGGTKVADWLALDETNFVRNMRLIGPDAIVFNGGMNDRGSGLSTTATKTDNASVFAANYGKVLDRIERGAPAATGLLVIPNEPSDVATTGIGLYPSIIKATAQRLGWACHDDRSVLGGYAAANAAGYMYDAVHPSSTGNALRGAAYAARTALI